MPVNEITGEEFPYSEEGIKKYKDSVNAYSSPDNIMKYGGFCPKKMPLESNNPRNIQGRKLRRGGCVKMMKGGSIK